MGTNDSEPTVAEIQRQQDEAEAEEKRRAQAQAALRGDREDLDDFDASPFCLALIASLSTALVVTCLFSLLAACHAGHWTLAEVTAPLWGTVLAGSVVALGAATVAATMDAWDGHCLRRAERRAGIRR